MLFLLVLKFHVSTKVNLVYELPYELPNDLKLRIIENKEILEKQQIWVETWPSASLLSRN